ncbi:MAG: hypothetical protein ACRCY3_12575 [Sphingorhabdus sp.]
MNISEYFFAWRAIILRLAYLALYGRRDIDLFAEPFAAALAGRPFSPTKDFEDWVRRARRQLALERQFPAGTRLGTFRNAPVLILDALRRGELLHPARYWADLESELRAHTGLAAGHDAAMLSLCGYSISSYFRGLRQLHNTDPVTVQLMVAKEFRFCAAARTIRKAENYAKAATIALAGDPLLLAGTALATHERALSIAHKLRLGAALDYKDLVKAAEEIESGRPLFVEDYSDYIETLPLSVPALFSIVQLGRWDRVAMVREVVRILTPRGRGGERTPRKLIHYYGLDLMQMLQIGLAETMTVCATIIDGRRPLYARVQCNDRIDKVTGLARAIIQDMATVEGWPLEGYEETRRKLDPVRRGYTRSTWQFGGGGRFDPRHWLDPERDAKLCHALTEATSVKRISKGSITARHRWALMRLMYISLSKSDRRKTRKYPELQLLVARAMAHMACAHSPFTSDPIFVPWQRFHLERSGYRWQRGRRGRPSLPFKAAADTGKRFKGALLNKPANGPRQAGTDFPIEGLI